MDYPSDEERSPDRKPAAVVLRDTTNKTSPSKAAINPLDYESLVNTSFTDSSRGTKKCNIRRKMKTPSPKKPVAAAKSIGEVIDLSASPTNSKSAGRSNMIPARVDATGRAIWIDKNSIDVSFVQDFYGSKKFVLKNAETGEVIQPGDLLAAAAAGSNILSSRTSAGMAMSPGGGGSTLRGGGDLSSNSSTVASGQGMDTKSIARSAKSGNTGGIDSGGSSFSPLRSSLDGMSGGGTLDGMPGGGIKMGTASATVTSRAGSGLSGGGMSGTASTTVTARAGTGLSGSGGIKRPHRAATENVDDPSDAEGTQPPTKRRHGGSGDNQANGAESLPDWYDMAAPNPPDPPIEYTQAELVMMSKKPAVYEGHPPRTWTPTGTLTEDNVPTPPDERQRKFDQIQPNVLRAFLYSRADMRNDPDFVKACLFQLGDPHCHWLRYCGIELLRDEDFALDVVTKFPLALDYFSPAIRRIPSIVLTAVRLVPGGKFKFTPNIWKLPEFVEGMLRLGDRRVFETTKFVQLGYRPTFKDIREKLVNNSDVMLDFLRNVRPRASRADFENFVGATLQNDPKFLVDAQSLCANGTILHRHISYAKECAAETP